MTATIKNLIIAFIFTFVLTQTCRGNLPDSTSQSPRLLNLDECLEMAIEMNHQHPASKYTVEIAEAQHHQVLSSYFPQLMLSSAYTVMDQDPNYIFPPSQMIIPPLNLGSILLNLPPIDAPKQEIKLMDKQNWVSSIQLNYPLYTGGMISSLKKQSSSAFVFIFLSSSSLGQDLPNETIRFNVGYSTKVFQNVNLRDAQAATQLFTKKLVPKNRTGYYD